jgi:hypothetical protein
MNDKYFRNDNNELFILFAIMLLCFCIPLIMAYVGDVLF